MVTCRICGCLCDPGDVRGGICDDCREEQEKKERYADKLAKLLTSPFEQMGLEAEGKNWNLQI